MAASRFLLPQLLLAFVGLFFLVAPVAAQSLSDVADEIDQTGRFVEFDVDADLEAAIGRANDSNIGFVWLNQSGSDAELIAGTVRQNLETSGSRYVTVVVLNNDGVWVQSRDGARASEAGTESFSDFLAGDVAGGLDTVTSVMSGTSSGATATTTVNAESDTDASATSNAPSASTDGGGFPWLTAIVIAGLAFFAFRFFSGRRRTAKAETANMERDRLEIREQLRDNADRVIELGDRAIKHGDAELIRLYEEASRTYQDVSMSIDGASTAAEVDELDERIDDAEWKFEVIEARIDGRPEPKSPADLEPPPPVASEGSPPPPTAEDRSSTNRGTVTRRGRTIPPLGAPNDRPALGHDESIFDQSTRQTRSSRPRRQSRGGGIGGMLSGGMGRMLMSLLASVLLGGMRGGGSRRSQRRNVPSFGGSRSGRSSGGLGGGVLKRR